MFNSTQSVKDWNLKCANKPLQPYTPEYWTVLKNQAERLVEEVKELVDAIDARDRLETVDAQADIQVVLDGFIFLSQHDHEGAMQAVCGNNDLKYTLARSQAEAWAGEIEKVKGLDVNVQMSEFEGKNYYSVHANADNKIVKPVNHPKVDMTPFIYGAGVQELMVVIKPHCPVCDGLRANLTNHLKIAVYSLVEPFESSADLEFCQENGLTVGDIVFYNGVELKKTNYGTEQFDIDRVERWLKGVGAL